MEGHRNKMAVLVTQINLVKEENQNLESMLNRMISNYDELQKQINHLTSLDRSCQIFSPEHQIEDHFNFRILSPTSVNVDLSDAAVSHQSNQSSDSHEQVREKDGLKSTRFMDDQQIPSNKRKINDLQLDQFDNGMINSSMNESPSKKHQASSNASGEQKAAAPKRIVYVRTSSEASVISDGCRWRKYGQKSTRNNPFLKSYYKCAMVPGCRVKKQVQRCAEDPTIVITTYEGEHNHSLSPLATDAMHAGSSNQITGEGMNAENMIVVDNQSIPSSTGCIARLSTSSPFPTIILDLIDDQPNPVLQLQPAHLAAGSFQHFIPSSNNMDQVLNQNHLGNNSSMMQDYVASIKADPNFTAALAVAIADSMLKLGTPVQGMPKFPSATQSINDSTREATVDS